MKRYLLYLVSMVMMLTIMTIMPVTAYADEDGFVPGYHEVHKEIHKVPGKKNRLRLNEALPSRYNSREEAWFRGIKVKDQGEAGLCWAFATTSAAEVSYAKESYESAGRVKEVSPGHQGFFLYNRVNDPLGNTAGDHNVPSSNWAQAGGTTILSMQHLATWSGAGLETNTPYSAITSNLIPDMETGTPEISSSFAYDDKYAYDDYITLENSIYYDETDTETLKDLVYTYGAAEAALNYDYDNFNNGDGISFYDFRSQEGSSNHAVLVVGWDDDYPKENFGSYSYSSGKYDKQPENDGAWIIQNSYGTSANSSGCFYVSYESKGITTCPVAAYDMQAADSYDYNYQYDGSVSWMSTGYVGAPYASSGSKAANVYTAKNNIMLKAAGITEYNLGETAYTIDVYTGLTDVSDPESGTLACSTDCTTTTPGCKTIKLSSPVVIEEGDLYSIVVTFHTDNTFFGVECNDDWNWVRFDAETSSDQSFFHDSRSSSWKDMSEQYNSCFRIKGFADRMYRVTFTDGKGNILKEALVEENGFIEPPEEPERKGYRFTGWDGDYYNVTSDMEINAVLEKLYHIVITDGIGGISTPDREVAIEGETVTITAQGDKGYGPDTGTLTVIAGGASVYHEIETKIEYVDGLQTSKAIIVFTMPSDYVSVNVTYSPRHQHEGEYHEAVEPTCVKDGSEEYWTCSLCDEVFDDEEMKDPIAAPVTIEKKGHTPGSTSVIKATPQKDGSHVTRCEVCGDKVESFRIPKPDIYLLHEPEYTYDGLNKKPQVFVIDSEGALITKDNYLVAYTDNVNAGTASALVIFIGDSYEGNNSVEFKIKKAENRMTATGKKYTVKYSKLKKKAQTIKRIKAVTVADADGNVTYTLSGVTKSKFKKYFKVSTAGKITVRKGLKKGKYTLKIKVKAAGDVNHAALTKTVPVKVTVN